ncbi:nitrate ABC transporter ATP-binding protein [Oscillatoriales cyanobacterium USR001]|nr:nitrate ABC transporter ATP-binding protein [Oscillatoriales cyanobacterium USR001]
MSQKEEEGKLFPLEISTTDSQSPTPNSSNMQTLDSKSTVETESLKSEPFLNIAGVSKVYETPKGPYIVLDGVNLSINQGEFICLIGHSGCGKSTLLNMIAGFNQPTKGSVSLKGERITQPGPDRMVVFQNYSLLPWLSATENVHLGVETVFADKSHADQMEIVNEHLELVGLTEAAHKRPGQLSGGMKQRVAIARALATNPQVLILDEPFGALDPITREELQEELLKIWEKYHITVIMITHDIDEALFLADRVVMMTNGPSAYIGEDLKIPFSRPRNRTRIMEDPQYYELRNFALDFLFRRFAHSEVEEEESTASSNTATSVLPEKAEKNIESALVTKSAASATKTVATIPFNTVKVTKESNMSADLKSSESSPGKSLALGAAWLVTMIGLVVVNVGSVSEMQSNLQKEAAQAEATAVSASPIPLSSPSLAPSPIASAALKSVPSTAASPSSIATSTSATTSPSPAPVTANTTATIGITDKAEIAALKEKLYAQINDTWKTPPTFTEDLVYRVKVKQDGSILQYEATNQVAKDFVKETPLATVKSPASSASTGGEKMAEFRVTFSATNGGALDVKPWE